MKTTVTAESLLNKKVQYTGNTNRPELFHWNGVGRTGIVYEAVSKDIVLVRWDQVPNVQHQVIHSGVKAVDLKTLS